MAIEKIALYNNYNTFYEWLNENALGVYFDEVVKNLYNINCNCGAKRFITFSDELDSSTYGITIETSSGKTVKYHSSSLKGTGYAYGWKTNSGLALSFGTKSSEITAPCIFITKDNSGKTAVILEKNFLISTPPYSISAVEQNSFLLTEYLNITPLKSSATSLCPVVISAANESYTPNVFCMPYTQYSGEAILEINGTKYLSNGVFAMKD